MNVTYPQHDAIIEMTPFNMCVRTLTPQARRWIEAHVTLDQVCTWGEGILEVPLAVSSDLMTAMLTANLKVVPASGRMMVSRAHIVDEPLELSISPH